MEHHLVVGVARHPQIVLGDADPRDAGERFPQQRHVLLSPRYLLVETPQLAAEYRGLELGHPVVAAHPLRFAGSSSAEVA